MSVALFSCDGRSGFGFARFLRVNGLGFVGLGFVELGFVELDFVELGFVRLDYAGLDDAGRDGLQSTHQGHGKSTVTGFIVTAARRVLAIPGALIHWYQPIPRGRCRHYRLAPT